jgi:site-specific DNA-cytosine methylase
LTKDVKLTWWIPNFLTKNFSKYENVTWSVEQVAHHLYISALEKKKMHYYVYEMWKYGICQNRKRVLVFNKPINLKEKPSVFLHKVLTIPKNAKYMGGSNVSPKKLFRDDLSLSIKPIDNKTIAYTVVSRPSSYLTKDYTFLRYLTLQESLELQTFPANFLDKFDFTVATKWQMCGNSVPPLMFKHIMETLVKN